MGPLADFADGAEPLVVLVEEEVVLDEVVGEVLLVVLLEDGVEVFVGEVGHLGEVECLAGVGEVPGLGEEGLADDGLALEDAEVGFLGEVVFVLV